MNKSKTKLIKVSIFFLVILVVSFFVYFQNQIAEQNIYKARKEFLDLSKIPSEEKILEKKEVLMQKEVLLKQRLFNKANPIEFIEFIENLGLQNFVSVTVDKIDSLEEGIVLDANAKGKIQDIKMLINSLENGDKEIIIKSVRFNRDLSKDSDVWNIYFNIIGKTE